MPSLRILSLVIVLALPSWAATRLVVAAGGASTGDCTVTACTVARAQAVAVGGDVITFAAGSYGSITISTSGTSPSSKITYQGFAAGGSCPSTPDSDVNSRGARPAPTAIVGGFNLNANYIRIDCFKVIQNTVVTITSQVFFDDIMDNYMDGFTTASCWDPATGTTHSNSACPTGSGNMVDLTNQPGASGTLPHDIYIGYNFCRGCANFAYLGGVNNLVMEFNESQRPYQSSGDGDHVNAWGDSQIFRYNYFWGSVYSDQPGAHTDCWQSWNASPYITVGWTNVQIIGNVCMNTDEGVIQDSANTEVSGPMTVINNIFAHVRLNGGFTGGGGAYTVNTTGTSYMEHNVFDAYTMTINCNTGPYGAGVAKNNITLNGGSFAGAGSCTTSNNVNSPSASSFVNLNYTVPGAPYETSGNYRLTASAATLINQGATLSPAVTVDMDGYTRTSPPDVGPYEYGTPCSNNWCQLTGGPGPLAISTSSLPGGTQWQAYSQSLQASGGTPLYSWSLVSGSLSPLTLSSGGTISGTPTAFGTLSFRVRVTDSATPTPATAEQALTITVEPAPALAITTSTLPVAPLGSAYAQTLQATGGRPAYTWALASGTLPHNLSLAANGNITGTPDTAGTSNFSVRVTDQNAASVTQPLSIQVTNCSTSSSAWQSFPFSAQSGSFTAAWDAIPSVTTLDGLMALSAAAATQFSQMAAATRFYGDATISALTGNANYVGSVAYAAGQSYHFRLVVNVPNHTYSAYVTPPGGSEQTLGTNLPFRTEQQGVASLGYLNLYEDSGSGNFQVCNTSIPATASYTLTVTKAGAGTGTISDAASGFSCSSGTCTQTYTTGSSITLAGTAAGGSSFSGWSGGTGNASSCSGTLPCTFTITQDSSLTGTFVTPAVTRSQYSGVTLEGVAVQ